MAGERIGLSGTYLFVLVALVSKPRVAGPPPTINISTAILESFGLAGPIIPESILVSCG